MQVFYLILKGFKYDVRGKEAGLLYFFLKNPSQYGMERQMELCCLA